MSGTVLCISGCAGFYSPVGFGSSSGAMVFTNMTFPGDMQDSTQVPNGDSVIGKIHGESSTHNIPGLVAAGDGGLNAAIEHALTKNGGDEIINIKVDTEVMSILGLFCTVTTHVYGTAIKY